MGCQNSNINTHFDETPMTPQTLQPIPSIEQNRTDFPTYLMVSSTRGEGTFVNSGSCNGPEREPEFQEEHVVMRSHFRPAESDRHTERKDFATSEHQVSLKQTEQKAFSTRKIRGGGLSRKSLDDGTRLKSIKMVSVCFSRPDENQLEEIEEHKMENNENVGRENIPVEVVTKSQQEVVKRHTNRLHTRSYKQLQVIENEAQFE